MEKTLFDAFARLTCQLSPENLCCDGELSSEQVALRLKRIKAEWKKLEEKAGRVVTQEEIEETWYSDARNGNRY